MCELSHEAACALLYERLTGALMEKKMQITAMESCTAGCIASLLTDTEGASAVMKGSLVTYSNEAKIQCGVPADVIEAYGVYSAETAIAMAQAARTCFGADIAIGVTGSLGRADPVNCDSVPGEVFYAIDCKGSVRAFFLDKVFGHDRHEQKLIIAEHVGARILQILDIRGMKE